jgi:hypothetical protein
MTWMMHARLLLAYYVAIGIWIEAVFAAKVKLKDDDSSIVFGVTEDVQLVRVEPGVVRLVGDLFFTDDSNELLSLSQMAQTLRSLNDTIALSTLSSSAPSMQALIDVEELQSHLEEGRQGLSAGSSFSWINTQTHTLTTLPVDFAYIGGVYSPSNNRIYFVPAGQADEAGKNWHYIACDTGF